MNPNIRVHLIFPICLFVAYCTAGTTERNTRTTEVSTTSTTDESWRWSFNKKMQVGFGDPASYRMFIPSNTYFGRKGRSPQRNPAPVPVPQPSEPYYPLGLPIPISYPSWLPSLSSLPIPGLNKIAAIGELIGGWDSNSGSNGLRYNSTDYYDYYDDIPGWWGKRRKRSVSGLRHRKMKPHRATKRDCESRKKRECCCDEYYDDYYDDYYDYNDMWDKRRKRFVFALSQPENRIQLRTKRSTQTIINVINDIITNLIQMIKEILKNVCEAFNKSKNEVLQFISDSFKSLSTHAFGYRHGAPSISNDKETRNLRGKRKAMMVIRRKKRSVISNFLNSITDNLVALHENIQNVVSEAYTKSIEATVGAANNVKSVVVDYWTALTTTKESVTKP